MGLTSGIFQANNGKFSPIREQDPLKQGLKQVTTCHDPIEKIREQDPLKQGLKPVTYPTQSFGMSVIREQDPLKQGLKLIKKVKRGVIFVEGFVSKIH